MKMIKKFMYYSVMATIIVNSFVGVSVYADFTAPQYIYRNFESSVLSLSDIAESTVLRTSEEKSDGNYSLKVTKENTSEKDFGYNVFMKSKKTYRIGGFFKGNAIAEVWAKIDDEKISLTGGVSNNGWVLYYAEYKYEGTSGVKAVCFGTDKTVYFADKVFVVPVDDGVNIVTNGELKSGNTVSFNLNGYTGKYYYSIASVKEENETALDNGFTDNGRVDFKIPTVAEGGTLLLTYSPVSADGYLEKYKTYETGTVEKGSKTSLSVNTETKSDFETDFLEENYNYDYASSVVPYANASFEWNEGDEDNGETGSLKCVLTSSFRSSPYYKVNLVKGKTYKLKARIKTEVDIPPEIFNFHITGTDSNGNSKDNLLLPLQNLSFEGGKWVYLESYFTWEGQVGETDTVNIKFRIGGGTWEEFFGSDSDIRTFTYYLDYFSIMPYMSRADVKQLGDNYTNGSIRLESSCDRIMLHSYPRMYEPVFVDGYEGAVYFLKINDVITDVDFGRDCSFKSKSDYFGKKAVCDVYPVFYGNVADMQTVDIGVLTHRENSFKVNYYDKFYNPQAEKVKGKVDVKIYDDTEPLILTASYDDEKRMIDVDEGEDFELDLNGVDSVSTYIWSKDIIPLKEKTEFPDESDSRLIYVDGVSGEDSNNGTYKKPYKTIKKAKDEVRKIISESNSLGNIRWNYSDGTLRISGGEMNDYTSDNPAPWTDCKDNVRTVIIDDGVKSIGSYAFYGFSNIKNVVLSESVESIGENAFFGCEKLSATVLGDKVSSVGDNAFDDKTSVCVSKNSPFADVTGYKTYTDGESSSSFLSDSGSIGWALYYDTMIFTGSGNSKAAVEQDNVPWKEYRTQIKNIVIQPEITALPRNFISGYSTDESGIKTSNYPNLEEYVVADTVKKISNNEIADCTSLKRFDISFGTENIMFYAIGNTLYTPIEELVIPSGVTSIGHCSFNLLNKLKKLTFLEGYNAYKTGTSEWESAFRKLDSLEELTLPSSMQTLGSYYFSRLGNLKKITVLNPQMEFETNCFYNIPDEGTVIGYKGSTAEEYANQIGWTFEEIDAGNINTLDLSDELSVGSPDKIYVLIKSGEYFIDEPLIFDYRDSSSDINIVYTSYGEGETVLHGGKKVTGWELFDSEKNIYKAYVGKDTKSRQLFVNGVRAQRARQLGALDNCFIDGGSIICDNRELLDFSHPEDMEITFHHVWTSPICGVDAVYETDDGKVKVDMASEIWNIIQTRGTAYAKYPYTTAQENVTHPWSMYSYENAYELLDEEGEWYLNSHDGYLYYKPRQFEDITSSDVVLPVSEQLVKVTGSKYLPVQNIEFNDITFAYTTWLEPTENKGFASGQNNVVWKDNTHNYVFPESAVLVECSKNIDFTDCTFTKLGSVALKLRNGVSECDIVGNEIYDISGNGICLGGQRAEDNNMPDESMKNKNNTVSNNYVHKIGVDYHGASGISTTYVSDTVLSNNEVFDVSYMGIHMGHILNENYIAGLTVKDNFVHDTGNNMVESCPIYTFSATAGTESNPNIISGNYVAYNWGRNAGIGNDYDVSNLIIKDNVIDGTHSFKCSDDYAYSYLENWRVTDSGVSTLNGGNIVFENNFGTHGMYIKKSAEGKGEIKSHTVCNNAVWTDEAKQIISKSGLSKEYSAETLNSVREIILDEEITVSAGKTEKLSYFAYGEKFETYSGDKLQMYCSSDNTDVLSVDNDGIISGISTGKANVKVCFKCDDILKWYTVAVTVK